MKGSGLFLSCDWGTSSFRLRLVQAHDLAILAEESNSQGIAHTFERWKASGKDDGARVAFYQALIQENLGKLQAKTNHDLNGLPLILSGMASSSIGMAELPYQELPFSTNGSDLRVERIPGYSHIEQDVYLLSGIKSDEDVMRGEETQVVGCFPDPQIAEQVFILPGTHSKHITVAYGQATAFRTYFTGELFSLLSNHSILANSIEAGAGLEENTNKGSFLKGLKQSQQTNLLHALFLVRTNQLFSKYSKQENYYFLSGLLIGQELRDLVSQETELITLVSNNTLQPYYHTALQEIGMEGKTRFVDIDQAIVTGHQLIYARIQAKEEVTPAQRENL